MRDSSYISNLLNNQQNTVTLVNLIFFLQTNRILDVVCYVYKISLMGYWAIFFRLLSFDASWRYLCSTYFFPHAISMSGAYALSVVLARIYGSGRRSRRDGATDHDKRQWSRSASCQRCEQWRGDRNSKFRSYRDHSGIRTTWLWCSEKGTKDHSSWWYLSLSSPPPIIRCVWPVLLIRRNISHYIYHVSV